MIHLPSACLSIVLALALAPSVQAQQESNAPANHLHPTTTTTTTTTIITTEPPITTTVTTVPPVTTTTIPPVTTTNPPISSTTSRDVVPPVTRPSNNNTSATHSSIQPTTSTGSNNANGGSSSSSSSSNVPAIVGGVVGVLALAVIVATSVICYKRRKRSNRELTFDTLEGMNGPALSSRKRASHNYLTSSSPVITSGNNIGLNSVPSAHGGYDDNYDYEMQSNVGYPTPLQPHNSAYHQSAYSNSNVGAYDAYGSPHQGYRPSPTIFQEDAPYATASSMGRGRTGFDQNLPEVMYNRGEIDHDPTAGFYHDEDIYNQGAWGQDQQHPHGGFIAEQGQWDVDAMLHQYDNEPELPLPPTHQHALSTPSLDSTLIGSPGRPKHQSATTHNPQAILESPILQSASLRSGDLFGQEGAGTGAGALGSPKISTQQATQDLEAVGGGRQTSNSSSPRIINASREMRSIEMASQSPTFGRPSTEAINSYATDYHQSRPSTDHIAGGAGSTSNLNANKSLRTHRREDW
ncbi:hypothetical protein BG015_010564 [Linnemannia schmuckeri]|uniref:receptor protein-tyrosine kinase n=1 Tax=Linnemannia schmuckeri TaxID=64567 RepID=A0A9P5RUB4_9FUNG|nr:hypothetical protein BG015_010564 [Linnemannia schmuckeri]